METFEEAEKLIEHAFGDYNLVRTFIHIIPLTG